jgi:PAS domain S-box-containing protein
MNDLSGRETQVVVYAAEGLTDKEIAARLDLHLGTVRTYWDRVRDKLKTNNRGESIAKLMAQLYRDQSRREREYEHMLRLVVESIPDFAIFLMETNGIVRSWNHGVKTVLQYDEDEWLGQSAEVIFTEEDRQAGILKQEIEVAMMSGRANNQRWHLRKDGSRFWGSGFSSTVLDEEDNLIGVVKIVRDHTLLTGDRRTLSPGDIDSDMPER